MLLINFFIVFGVVVLVLCCLNYVISVLLF